MKKKKSFIQSNLSYNIQDSPNENQPYNMTSIDPDQTASMKYVKGQCSLHAVVDKAVLFFNSFNLSGLFYHNSLDQSISSSGASVIFLLTEPKTHKMSL